MTAPTATPTKPWYASKTTWAVIITIVLALYDMFKSRYDWPPIPEQIYAILLAFGLYGVRTATTTIGPPSVQPAAPVTAEQPNNVVPADPALPFPGGDGSPLENRFQMGNGEAVLDDQPPLTGAQGFLSAGAVMGVAGSLLGSPLLEGVVKALLQASGLPVTPAMVLDIGSKIATIAPDLLDGNPQLSTENLNKINRIIMDERKLRGI